jgi:hypothetical protein
MKCAGCGKELPADAKVCDACGHQVGMGQKVSSEASGVVGSAKGGLEKVGSKIKGGAETLGGDIKKGVKGDKKK